MLETEIHQGDEERQNLRIESQRLRQELSDLKVEAEITQEKLANAVRLNERLQRLQGYQHSDAGESTTPSTPVTASSPLSKASTPHSSIHHSPAPPSPPISEASTTPSISSSKYDPSATPRPLHYKQVTNRHTRGPSVSSAGGATIPVASSRSLNQIRGLIGQMQKLEQRVQNARSKLPAPNIQTTPTKASPPRSNGYVPQAVTAVTIRSHNKGRPGSTVSNSSADTTTSSQFGSSRLSYGIPERPSSRMNGHDMDRPLSRASRPESRASQSSRTSIGQSSIPTPTSSIPTPSSIPTMGRPQSRTSIGSGRITPLSLSDARLPRASLSASSGRGSISHGQYGVDDEFFAPIRAITAPLQAPISRRNTFTKGNAKLEGSGIARPPSTPVGSGLPRRSLGGSRRSSSVRDDIMGPPSRLARKKIGDIH